MNLITQLYLDGVLSNCKWMSFKKNGEYVISNSPKIDHFNIFILVAPFSDVDDHITTCISDAVERTEHFMPQYELGLILNTIFH